MRWYAYPPAPGTDLGPCADPCPHKDCARMREDACQICLCGKPIGYEGRIVFMEGNRIVHLKCYDTWATGNTDDYLIRLWDRFNTPTVAPEMINRSKAISVYPTPALAKTARAYATDNDMTISRLYDLALRTFLDNEGLTLDKPTTWGGRRNINHIFCLQCRGEQAHEYRGIDGKTHVKCPKCGIIS